MGVGDPAEQPAAERPHEEADRKDSCGGEELTGRIAGWEKSGGKIDGRESIGVEIIPFDEIARRCAYDCNDAPAAIRGSGHLVGHGDAIGNRGHSLLPIILRTAFFASSFSSDQGYAALLCRGAR